jgi:hypothetical protein
MTRQAGPEFAGQDARLYGRPDARRYTELQTGRLEFMPTTRLKGILWAAGWLIAFGFLHAADYFPPPDSAGGWRTATNVAQVRELAGMDLPKLEQAWEFTQRCTQNGG